MRWNPFIALFLGGLALLQLGIDALICFHPDRGTLGYGDMLFGGNAAGALVLSYPLLRGRNWARVALIARLSCCGVGVVLLVTRGEKCQLLLQAAGWLILFSLALTA